MADQINLCVKLDEFMKKSVMSEDDWKKLNELLIETHVPENTIIETRPFEAEDFSTVPYKAKFCFITLDYIFSNLIESSIHNSKAGLKCIYSTIVLCGEHSSQNLWTDEECIKKSHLLLETMLFALKCESLISFLMKTDNRRKFHGINTFAIMLPKLSNNSWKFYPSMVHSYSWLLHHIETPNMKEYVNLLLPVSLNIVKDYVLENRILGLECLRHIITNISKAELHWHIEVQVIQGILKPLFYHREWELTLPLIKCTLEVADKSKPGFRDSGVNLEWSYLDDILSIFLPMMEYEQDIDRRQAYGKSLYLVLKASNLAIGRWSDKLLQIIDDYSKTSITELDAALALNLYIQNCWPLVKNHWKLITLIAGRMIYHSSNKKTIVESEITFQLLKELLPNETTLMNVEYIKTRRKKCEIYTND